MPSKETPSGSCEKTGGGEWTALRELVAKWRTEAAKGRAKAAKLKLPTQELTEYDTAMEHCAAELEALAAAAPAPPPTLQVGHDESRGDLCEGNSSGLRTESPSTFVPPPQAGPSNLGAVARQAREYYKTLLNNANMCAAAWLIHEAPIVTEVPSKAERRVATATDGLGVAELRDMLEAACVLAELDEVPAKVTILRWRAALRGEKKPVPSGNEAVAGNASGPPRGGSSSDLADSVSPSVGYSEDSPFSVNHAALALSYQAYCAKDSSHPLEWRSDGSDYLLSYCKICNERAQLRASAPVGEKRQPSEKPVIDLDAIAREMFDDGFEKCTKTQQTIIRRRADQLKHALAGQPSGVGEPPHCPSCNTSLPDLDYRAEGAMASWAPREVGEGLREALRKVNHLQHSMAIELDAIPQQPRIEYWTRQMEEVICAALAAPAPKPAPPAEPCFTCEGEQGLPPTRTVRICERCFGEDVA